MLIHVEITHRLDIEIEKTVVAKRREHVVVEADASVDAHGAATVEINRDPDVGFQRLASLRGAAAHGRYLSIVERRRF